MNRFHFTLLTLVVGLALAGPAQAQLSVEVRLEQEQFLRDESLPLWVRVTNRSGQPLELGTDDLWLSFALTKRDGTLATRLSPVPVRGSFTLESSQVAERKVDLMPHYLLEPGRYEVTATVRVSDWNRQFPSQAKTFEVVRGVKIWEQTVGIPQDAGGTSPPELRRFVLLQARYLKTMYLYVRITGATDNKVYRVFPLGQVVNFVPAERRIDRQSNLHVLFQTGPRSFNYSVVTPQAQLLKRQRHDYFQSRPTLGGDEDGRIFVVGGIRRLVPTDYPPAAVLPETNDVQAPSP